MDNIDLQCYDLTLNNEQYQRGHISPRAARFKSHNRKKKSSETEQSISWELQHSGYKQTVCLSVDIADKCE